LYLLKAFRRRLLKEIKKGKKHFQLEESSQSEMEIIFSIEEELIDEEERLEREQRILKALKELNPRLREVLYYKFNCGYDYDQICEIMSISYDSARQMASRSVTKKLI
jgi:RNA polymerase sigma factor (sigma-70 family)